MDKKEIEQYFVDQGFKRISGEPANVLFKDGDIVLRVFITEEVVEIHRQYVFRGLEEISTRLSDYVLLYHIPLTELEIRDDKLFQTKLVSLSA